MNISFDVLPLISEQMSGIGYYQSGLIAEIIKSHPENNYYYEYFAHKNKEAKRNRLLPFMKKNCFLNESKFSGFLYRSIMNFIPIPYNWFFGSKSEVTHFFNYIIPPFVSGKKVVTIHDMVIKAYPETVRFRTKQLLYTGMKKSMRRADVIVTDSEFSKNEIIKYYPKYAHKLQVVPCGVDKKRFYPIKDKDIIEKVKLKLNIDGLYFLYLGNIEPRKNLKRLVEAYSIFLKDKENPPKLVLAGGKGWLNNEIYNMVETLNIKDSVVFSNYVDEEDVCPLINGALAFLFPSIYEGFGLPPLEAMSCGVPVLTSQEASLPEVVEESAISVDAYSTQEIASGINKLFQDEKLREELSLKGIEQSNKFTWEKAAEKLYEVYKQIC